MKKFVTLIIFILLAFCAVVSYEKSSYIKIFKIDTPSKIYIDTNKNFLFDEKIPYEIDNLYYINDFDDELSDELKFLFNYFAVEEAKKATKNAFCKIDNSHLYINDKNYRDILLNTDFFYDNTLESKNKFKENLKKYNPDDYVIVNLKSNKYHKINCEKAKEIKHFKIINKNQINENYNKAKCCFIDFHTNQTITTVKPQNSKNFKFSTGNVSVYFLNLSSLAKPDNHCKTEACSVLKNQIDNTKQTIDFAIYGFNNEPELYNSLKRAKERGVKIRWVLNYDNSNNLYYPDLEKLKELLPDYISNDKENNGHRKALMHNKFFIFDDQIVYTGSANISATDLSGFNTNYTVLIDSADIAEIYKQEFEQMFAGKFSNDKVIIQKNPVILQDGTKIEVLFSPKDLIINNKIIDLINNAKNYIYIPSFFITDKNIKDALIRAKDRNVEIKVITDATSAASKYSVHNELREANIPVKTENYAGKMHAKSLVIDDNCSLIGSMNFTSSGNKRNDENVLIIYNSEIAKYMKSTFMNAWKSIPDKYLKYDPKAESNESVGSCADGIDNDYDNKIDSKDEGCIIKQYQE